MPTIILTGGGTGGHIFPNIALLGELKKRNFRVVYLGGEGNSMESQVAKKNSVQFFSNPTIKLVRSLSLTSLKNNIQIPTKLLAAVKNAQTIIAKIKPDIVFSKGGFVALPITLAAAKLGVPVVCHESDQSLGLANKIARQKGATVLCANPKSTFGQFVGMPLREELFHSSKILARQKLAIDMSAKVLLVIGGSSGASALNDVTRQNLKTLTENFFVIHITGKNKGSLSANNASTKSEFVCQNNASSKNNNFASYPSCASNNLSAQKIDNYLQMEFCDNMPDIYAASDIVVSRAGATAVAEISALKKRALFIPLPKGVSRGDQIYNANLAEEFGASVILQDSKLCENFCQAILAASKQPPMKSIAENANKKIVDILCQTIDSSK